MSGIGNSSTRIVLVQECLSPNNQLHADCSGRTSVVTCQFNLAQAAGEPYHYFCSGINPPPDRVHGIGMLDHGIVAVPGVHGSRPAAFGQGVEALETAA